MAASSERVRRSSLRRLCEMWVCTVRGDKYSCAARRVQRRDLRGPRRPRARTHLRPLYDRRPGETQIVRFTREQGADFHCQPMARALTGMVMTDFRAAHLE